MSVCAIYHVADIWIEIYSGIARFRCDSMALVIVAHGQLSMESVVFEANSYSYYNLLSSRSEHSHCLSAVISQGHVVHIIIIIIFKFVKRHTQRYRGARGGVNQAS